MTHPKPPIDLAVEALAMSLREVIAVSDRKTDEYDRAKAALAAYAALRASTGKMKAAEHWVTELSFCCDMKRNDEGLMEFTGQIDLSKMERVVERIQADALAAQPEPRPLPKNVMHVSITLTVPVPGNYAYPTGDGATVEEALAAAVANIPNPTTAAKGKL